MINFIITLNSIFILIISFKLLLLSHNQKMNHKNESSTMKKYKELKESFAIPMKIKMFYTLLEDSFSKHTTPTISKDQTKKYKTLLSAFKKQSQQQKQRYLYQTLEIVKSNITKDQDTNSNQNDCMDQIKDIQTTCKIKENFIGFAKWEKRNFHLNLKSYKIKISDSKKQLVYSLPFYFVRKSHGYAKTLILQAISDSIQSSKSEIYIYFDNNILFEEIYNHVFNCIISRNAKQILKMTNEKEQNQQILITTNDQVSKASMILTAKVLNEYFVLKQKILKKLQNYTYKFENIQTYIPNIKIGISKHKNKDRLKVQKIYQSNLQSVQAKISLCTRKKDQKLVEFQVLQTFSNNICVIYFKYLFNNEIYEFLTILEENNKKNQKILILKGIDNFINKQFIDFLTLKLIETDGKVFLSVMGIIKHEQKNRNQGVEFLLSLLESAKATPIMNITQSQYWTAKQMQNTQMGDQGQYFVNQPQLSVGVLQDDDVKNQQKNSNAACILLKKYTIDPLQQPLNIFLAQHPLFKQWRLYKTGGVICTDEEQINLQKKLFKHILSKIGSNLIQCKNILNVSFPVVIFRKESHLKSIARNFSYAPIFLEKVAKSSPSQRMKAVVLFQISMSNLVISMNKPFNPILGQTYQGLIDGCPIILQQTSHHPPISHYLFHGRGYKFYGYIEPKIAIGLNCVKGWSAAPCIIQFDDGTVIEFNMNKMIINGMLFGERTFNFEGSCYAIDHKNKLAAEICYGIENNSVFKKKQLTYDSVSGGIYNLSAQNGRIFGQNFKKNEKQRVCSFKGTWHSELMIDGKKEFNFLTDLPHELFDTEQPLPSDCRFRTDLIQLIKNNIDKAQIQKERLEQLQRRDKKLRESCKCKK